LLQNITFSSPTTPATDNKCFALQWNLRGLRANISELKQLLVEHDPCVVALQETKAKQTTVAPDFIGRGYTLLLESKSAHYWQHGVGLAIKDGIPFERLQITTSLHLIAARIHKPIEATVVSLYIPLSAQCQTALNDKASARRTSDIFG
jgi:exonuclease III